MAVVVVVFGELGCMVLCLRMPYRTRAPLNGDMLCDVFVVVRIRVNELCQGPRGMMVLRNLLASAWSRWKEVVTLATEHLMAQAYTKSKGTSKLPTECVSLQTVAMH
jgi:hypothetical protein